MSDLKKAELAEAKLGAQVAAAGLHITDNQPPSAPFSSSFPGHEISGVLDGTHSLTIAHNVLDRGDDLNLTIEGGHNFNLTIAGFDPLFFNGSSPPPLYPLLMGVLHDELQLTFDPSSGINSLAQAAAAETVQQNGNDLVLHIDAPSAHGTITFSNLADLVPAGETENFGWIVHYGTLSQAV